jgi:hypothetical protein
MTPVFLCLIVLAMPLAIALAAWAERRAGSARAYQLNAMAGDNAADADDESTLFQQ